jgi:hypothetical protein
VTNELDRKHLTGDEDRQAYARELLLALRMRGVPGPRVAEVLAEVDSHVRESGEHPRDAFGEARVYADQIASALGERDAPTPFWRAALSWRTAVYGVGGAVGAWLVIDGAVAFAADERAVGGLPAAVALLAGFATLLALAVGLARLARAPGDRVLDPRSGADMAPPMPRWVMPVMVGVPVLSLALAGALALTTR